MISKAIKTPFGHLYMAASPKGIQALYWEKPLYKDTSKDPQALAHLTEAEKQLKEYFAGKRYKFELKYDLIGTDFQKKVWKSLAKLPYGSTCSYKDLAAKTGSPKAFRAVGSANGKNPLPIFIPCHRVINAQGQLGGYSGKGGLQTKKFLLDLESS